MQDDDKKHDDQFDASLPLPEEAAGQTVDPKEHNPAADLIRKRVDSLYEPSAKEELEEAADADHLSKHQKYILQLTSSGKSLREIQEAWHEYYQGLSDHEKHQVWDEFYKAHQQAAVHPSLSHVHHQPGPSTSRRHPVSVRASRLKDQLSERLPAHTKQMNPHLHSLLFGLGVGSIVLIVFLFSFFNERIIAPFIQPSRNVTNTQIIASGIIGKNPEIIIPKINVEIPVVYGVDTISEAAVDKGLENGVIHYADTAMPGQNGNAVFFGHSSNNIFNPGKYKFAFVLLSRLEAGDTFYLQKNGVRYTYQVYSKKIVSPKDVSVLDPADKPAVATLITCDPPGTSLNRLVVVGEQIDPDPAGNTTAPKNVNLASQTTTLPSNAPSLWSRIVKWLSS